MRRVKKDVGFGDIARQIRWRMPGRSNMVLDV